MSKRRMPKIGKAYLEFTNKNRKEFRVFRVDSYKLNDIGNIDIKVTELYNNTYSEGKGRLIGLLLYSFSNQEYRLVNRKTLDKLMVEAP